MLSLIGRFVFFVYIVTSIVVAFINIELATIILFGGVLLSLAASIVVFIGYAIFTWVDDLKFEIEYRREKRKNKKRDG